MPLDHRRSNREANKERDRIRALQWREENAEKVRAIYKRWYDEKGLKYGREWRKANPEAVRASKARREAAMRGAEGEVSEAIVTQMLVDQDGLCAYCEVPLMAVYEIDHIVPIKLGGIHHWTNIAISCPPCNRRKSAKLVEDFMES